jgi:transcriptional regulator with XRE-family HTH domain
MTLFENVKMLANNKGMSLQDVAKKSGMGVNSIYKWKNPNYNPSKPAIIAVANTLGVSEEKLKGEITHTEKKHVDLADDDLFMTYQGKPLSDEDKELIKRILRGK